MYLIGFYSNSFYHVVADTVLLILFKVVQEFSWRIISGIDSLQISNIAHVSLHSSTLLSNSSKLSHLYQQSVCCSFPNMSFKILLFCLSEKLYSANFFATFCIQLTSLLHSVLRNVLFSKQMNCLTISFF